MVQQGKRFFFEKKNQKTFVSVRRALSQRVVSTFSGAESKRFLRCVLKSEGAALIFCALAGAAHAQAVTRTPLIGSDFPISAAVSVKAGTDIVYLSGAMGPVVDKTAPAGSVESRGDTATQATGALTALQATLKRLGLDMGDVVKMNVFLVADPKLGKMDFPGLMAGYTKFFGTKDQPNTPARSAVQVAGLAAPGALVEIEVIAAHGK